MYVNVCKCKIWPSKNLDYQMFQDFKYSKFWRAIFQTPTVFRCLRYSGVQNSDGDCIFYLFSVEKFDLVSVPAQHATARPVHPQLEGRALAGDLDCAAHSLELRRPHQAELQERSRLIPEEQVPRRIPLWVEVQPLGCLERNGRHFSWQSVINFFVWSKIWLINPNSVTFLS